MGRLMHRHAASLIRTSARHTSRAPFPGQSRLIRGETFIIPCWIANGQHPRTIAEGDRTPVNKR